MRLKTIAAVGSTLAPSIGYLELLGIRFPVKAYQAQVREGLRRGSRLDAAGVKALKAEGFKSIVSFNAERNLEEERTARELGLKLKHIPAIDNTVFKPAQMVELHAFVNDPENQPVYAHCEAGKGRTGIGMAFERMATEGWPVGRALAEAKGFGLKLRSQKLFIRKLGRLLREHGPSLGVQ